MLTEYDVLRELRCSQWYKPESEDHHLYNRSWNTPLNIFKVELSNLDNIANSYIYKVWNCPLSQKYTF